MPFEPTRAFAQSLDGTDPLGELRQEFCFPMLSGKPALYFCGNSLGLAPRRARDLVVAELDDWANYGVEGHTGKLHGWLSYHELVTPGLARVVGAKPHEVVAMNSLTTNLHLLMVSFYRPDKNRYKILMEAGAFPSDTYAVASQLRYHGFDPDKGLITLKPRAGEDLIRTEDILTTIDHEGDSIALVLLGQVNYLTGQAFATAEIAAAAHAKGCIMGLDLAHGVGNLGLQLHAEQIDFAVWCHYKYMNAGPGAIGGAFIHEKHFKPNYSGPRFEGWWGQNKSTRFQMPAAFDPINTVEAWQLSNPPIFQLAALRASLELFDTATMPALVQKSRQLTGYLAYLCETELAGSGAFKVITPPDPLQRGCQLSLRCKVPRDLNKKISQHGVICDFREPDIMRIAPAPLYNSYEDVYQLVEILKGV